MPHETPQDPRVLPPSDNGKYARAFGAFADDGLRGFGIGAMIGAGAMVAFMGLLAPQLIMPGLLAGVASVVIYSSVAAVGMGLLTGTIKGGLRMFESLKNDHFNQQERDAIGKERPVNVTPIIDPELANAPQLPPPRTLPPEFFQQKLLAETTTPAPQQGR